MGKSFKGVDGISLDIGLIFKNGLMAFHLDQDNISKGPHGQLFQRGPMG
jgi:hypothetical protein